MIEKELKEADVLRNIIDRIGYESELLHADELNLLEKVREVYRHYLSASEEVPELGVSTGIHDELTYGYGKLDEHGFFEFELTEKEYEAVNAYRQAVLPVVAKKDMIIADLKHNNQCLTESIEQAHSYWKSAEKKVAEQAKRIEDLASDLARIWHG